MIKFLHTAAFTKAIALPLKTWRNWEQGWTRIDPAGLALLRLIAANPVEAIEILAATIELWRIMRDWHCRYRSDTISVILALGAVWRVSSAAVARFTLALGCVGDDRDERLTATQPLHRGP